MEVLVETECDVTELIEVPGYVKLYAVTRDGRVYSYPKGTHKEGKFLRAKRGTHGYLEVRLSKDGAAKTYLVHKLVLLSFQGERPSPEHTASHLNGNCWDNSADNLVWELHAQNNKRKIQHGTSTRGERNWCVKLTEALVSEIKELYATGDYTLRQLAERYGVHNTMIGKIVNGKKWAHVI